MKAKINYPAHSFKELRERNKKYASGGPFASGAGFTAYVLSKYKRH